MNFGDVPFTLPAGQVIKPRDSVTYRVTADGRQYTPPPCPNVFATP